MFFLDLGSILVVQDISKGISQSHPSLHFKSFIRENEKTHYARHVVKDVWVAFCLKLKDPLPGKDPL